MHNVLRTTSLLGGLVLLPGLPGWALAGGAGAWLGLALGLCCGLLAYLYGAALVLRLYDAHEVGAQAAPHLLAMVRELASRASLPAPRVFLLDDIAANAFVVGRTRGHANLVLTSGILRLLDEVELRAVLAHEFARILNGDMLPGTLAAAVGGLLALASESGLGLPGHDGAAARRAPLWWLLAPLAAALARLGSAGRREFAADRTGARLCGDPAALARALQHLHAGPASRHGLALAGRFPAGAQMMVCDPPGRTGLQRLFHCHPPLARRVQALRAEAEAA